MKQITAIVKPFKAPAVKEALQAAGIGGMTLTEVQGFGRQSGHTEVYRGAEYTVDLVPKAKLEVIVTPDEVESIAALIVETARTGQIGDGKIWVTDLGGVTRIRTGERDADAV